MALLSSFAISYEMIVAFQALLGIWHSGFAINAPSVIKDLFNHVEAKSTRVYLENIRLRRQRW